MWKVEVLRSTTQSVHMKVKWKDSPCWFMTAVYGSPHIKYRGPLWQELRDIRTSMTNCWVVGGDFNTILHPYERCRGAQFSIFRDISYGRVRFEEATVHHLNALKSDHYPLLLGPFRVNK